MKTAERFIAQAEQTFIDLAAENREIGARLLEKGLTPSIAMRRSRLSPQHKILTLVTRDTEDYRAFRSLRIENWFAKPDSRDPARFMNPPSKRRFSSGRIRPNSSRTA